MSQQLGRISGPLLKDDLLRDGVDIAFESDLLYLNVNSRRIGINSDTPTRDLFVNDTISTTNLIVDTQLEVGADLAFLTNTIRDSLGTSPISFIPDQTTNPVVRVPSIDTSSLLFTTQKFENFILDSNIELTADGTGKIHFTTTQVNVNGDLHATGDITWDGDIVFGDSSNDSVTFKSDITSDIVPDLDNQYTLGELGKEWKTLYTHELSADTVTLIDTVIAGNTNLVTTQGAAYYVTQLGNDTNVGNHLHAPFRSIKHALSVATDGDSITIFPGTYQEEFPLTVPTGVSVNGMSLRSVSVIPTLGTNDKDAFLLNGETTVNNLTVSNFFYNSTNNTGYAFRFADGMKVSSRSPYIYDCSVITRGSVTSGSDPLGFANGDAGRGALVDGELVDVASNQATMLFHNCTFITPNANAVTMTNGVRVEWLNSFTYFANRGLYATQGTTGRQVQAGTQPGQINVGPAPTGASLTSDSVTLSKAYYSQVLVDSLVGQTAVIDRYPNQPLLYTVVSIETEPLDPTQWRMTVETTFNPAGQLKPISFYPDVETTLILTQDIWDTTGNSIGEKWVAWYKTNLPPIFETTVGPDWTINVAGTLYIIDYIIEDPVNTNMWRIYVTTSLVAGVGIPIFSSPAVGSITKYGAEVRSIASADVYGNYGAWADGPDTLMYLVQHNFGYIGSGADSSNDLTLVSESQQVVELNSGRIYYQSVDQSGVYRVGDVFYVNPNTGATSLNIAESGFGASSLTLSTGDNVTYIDFSKISTGNLVFRDNTISSLIGAVNFTSASGEINLTQNVSVTKDVDITGDLNVDGILTFGNQVTDDIVFTSNIDSDIIPKLNKQYTIGNTGQRWLELFTKNVYVNDIHISDNIITSINTNTNLQVTANGSGKIIIAYNDVDVTNNFAVYGLATTKSINITGDTDQTGNYEQTGYTHRIGNTDITGNLTVSDVVSFQNIEFNANVLKNKATNADLTFEANGAGIVSVPLNDVVIENDLTGLVGTTYLDVLTVTTTVTSDIFDVSDVYINDNYITTLQTNQNLQLLADGTGRVYVPAKNVEIVNQLEVNGDTTIKSLVITGDIDQTGDYDQTGNAHRTGNTDITGTLTVTEVARLQDVKIETNQIITTATDADLILTANGLGTVYVPTDNVRILNDLTVTGTAYLDTVNVTTTTTADIFDISDVYINDNYITTLQTNQNLLVEANGTGKIYVPLKDVAFDQNTVVANTFRVNVATALQDTEIAGTVIQTGNYNQTGDIDITGDVQTLNFSVLNPSYFQYSNFKAYDNKIDVLTTNNDLTITGNGTGGVVLETRLKFVDDTISNVWASATTDTQKSIVFSPNGTGNLVIDSTKYLKIPVANNSNRVMYNYGEIRQNSTTTWYEGYLPTGPVSFNNLYDFDKNTYATAELTPGTNDGILRFGINGTVKATIDSTKLHTNTIHVDNIRFTGNVIDHLTVNDINIVPTGTGVVNINDIWIKDNVITNTVDGALSITNTGNGYTKFGGTYGVRIPSGPTIGPEGAEIGMLRYNTQLGLVRVFDGVQWISAAGNLSSLTQDEVTDIMDIWTIILG